MKENYQLYTECISKISIEHEHKWNSFWGCLATVAERAEWRQSTCLDPHEFEVIDKMFLKSVQNLIRSATLIEEELKAESE